ncbi:zinc ribbon domain-containing protein [Sporosarcina koreensis]|uniref:zinc ribbon domain-containing protein n=1 Tax=Sporosarcina koreensis TaxID=334735 RepID=UPI00058B7CD9|nr:zinc ribbon domain-containing protein [Sporosarcina koreensis]
MKTCPVCSHAQLEGNFCGECGTSYSSARKRAETVVENPSASNGTWGDFGKEVQSFFRFVVSQAKAPSSHIHTPESSFPYSVMSILLYVFLAATSFYSLYAAQLLAPAWLSILLKGSLLLLLFLSINLAAIKATAMTFSVTQPLPELIRKLGGFFAVPIILSSASLLLTFLDAHSLAVILLSVSAAVAFILVPLYVTLTMLSDFPDTIDGFNGLLFYASCTIVGVIVLLVLIADTAIGGMLGVFR